LFLPRSHVFSRGSGFLICTNFVSCPCLLPDRIPECAIFFPGFVLSLSCFSLCFPLLDRRSPRSFFFGRTLMPLCRYYPPPLILSSFRLMSWPPIFLFLTLTPFASAIDSFFQNVYFPLTLVTLCCLTPSSFLPAGLKFHPHLPPPFLSFECSPLGNICPSPLPTSLVLNNPADPPLPSHFIPRVSPFLPFFFSASSFRFSHG